jgi:hypothetical protein
VSRIFLIHGPGKPGYSRIPPDLVASLDLRRRGQVDNFFQGVCAMTKRILLFAFISIGCLVTAPAIVSAQEVKYELKVSAKLGDVLAENTGKRVALKLVSGEEVEGTVTAVGKELVHVSRLSGKEYYDAVISLDKITAIRMKMRER